MSEVLRTKQGRFTETGPVEPKRYYLGDREISEGERFAFPAPGSLRGLAQLVDNARQQLKAIGVAVNRTLDPMRQAMHAMDARGYPKDHVRCHRCHPCANPKPLAVDGREYARRRKGRRRAS